MRSTEVDPRIGPALAGLRALLRESELRCTDQRRAIVSLLAVQDGPGHLSAVEVHRRLQGAGHRVDLSTVYRTLAVLAEIGVLHATARPEQPTSYGLATIPHHHAVCTRCGELTEIPAEPLAGAMAGAMAELSQPTEPSDKSRRARFRVSGSLLLSGVCAHCLSP